MKALNKEQNRIQKDATSGFQYGIEKVAQAGGRLRASSRHSGCQEGKEENGAVPDTEFQLETEKF